MAHQNNRNQLNEHNNAQTYLGGFQIIVSELQEHQALYHSVSVLIVHLLC